jgi:hypothetical protein
MPNIATMAVQPIAEASAGKTPVNGNATAGSVKSDFRRILAVAKAASSASPQTLTESAKSESPQVLAGAKATGTQAAQAPAETAKSDFRPLPALATANASDALPALAKASAGDALPALAKASASDALPAFAKASASDTLPALAKATVSDTLPVLAKANVSDPLPEMTKVIAGKAAEASADHAPEVAAGTQAASALADQTAVADQKVKTAIAEAAKTAVATQNTPATLAAALPQTEPADSKTAKTGKKEPAHKAEAGNEIAGPNNPQAALAAALPATAPPPAAAPPPTATIGVAAAGHLGVQAHSGAVQRPTATSQESNKLAAIAAQSSQSSQASGPPGTFGAGAQTLPQNAGAANNVTPNHKIASPHQPVQASQITAQLANAMPASVAKTGAPHVLHVSLTPETLGKITVKIEQTRSGDAQVTITATQPETLAAMKKDTEHLNQILTNAGLPEANRQIEFRVAPVEAAPSSASLGDAGAGAGSLMQGNSGRQQAPQDGTGFAYNFAKGDSASPLTSASLTSPVRATGRASNHASASGNLNMIA